jgi:hypothetical protein
MPWQDTGMSVFGHTSAAGSEERKSNRIEGRVAVNLMLACSGDRRHR